MSGDRGPALRWTLVVVTTFLVHLAVAVDLDLFGVHPDLLLLVAITAGMVAGPTRGAEVGFFAGLLGDLVRFGNLGVTALSYALVGFGVGALSESMLRTSRAVSVGVTAAASVAGTLLYAAVAHLVGEGALSDPHLWRILGIVAVANSVLCVPALALGRWAEGSAVRSGLS